MTKDTAPDFAGESNLALKVPRYCYEATMRFYRDVLNLPLRGRSPASPTFPQGSPAFELAGMRLWLDEVQNYSQRDLWLQLRTSDLERAMRYLRDAGIPVRDELEPLGNFPGHWISDPAGTVLLVSQAGAEVTLLPTEVS